MTPTSMISLSPVVSVSRMMPLRGTPGVGMVRLRAARVSAGSDIDLFSDRCRTMSSSLMRSRSPRYCHPRSHFGGIGQAGLPRRGRRLKTAHRSPEVFVSALSLQARSREGTRRPSAVWATLSPQKTTGRQDGLWRINVQMGRITDIDIDDGEPRCLDDVPRPDISFKPHDSIAE